MSPRDLLCYRDDNSPHLPKKTSRFFVLSTTFIFWAIKREELVNLLCGIRRRECGVGLDIRVENVEESFTNDTWVVVWTFKDKIEGGRISHDGGRGDKVVIESSLSSRSQNSPVSVSNMAVSVQVSRGGLL